MFTRPYVNMPTHFLPDCGCLSLLVLEFLRFCVMARDDRGIEPEDMREEGLPVGMFVGEFAQLEDIAEVALRPQKIAEPLAEMPGIERPPVEYAVQKFLGPIERYLDMVPLAVGQRREILMPGRMLLEGDLGRFLDAATDSHIAALRQLDL